MKTIKDYYKEWQAEDGKPNDLEYYAPVNDDQYHAQRLGESPIYNFLVLLHEMGDGLEVNTIIDEHPQTITYTDYLGNKLTIELYEDFLLTWFSECDQNIMAYGGYSIKYYEQVLQTNP